jgi:hypothetical protein
VRRHFLSALAFLCRWKYQTYSSTAHFIWTPIHREISSPLIFLADHDLLDSCEDGAQVRKRPLGDPHDELRVQKIRFEYHKKGSQREDSRCTRPQTCIWNRFRRHTRSVHQSRQARRARRFLLPDFYLFQSGSPSSTQPGQLVCPLKNTNPERRNSDQNFCSPRNKAAPTSATINAPTIATITGGTSSTTVKEAGLNSSMKF